MSRSDSRMARAQWNRPRRRGQVQWIVPALLFTLWILGLLTSWTLGGTIHLLLLAALGMILWRMFGRRPLV